MATYSDDPTLYLYTSLTAGSSHIVTATSRLETILRANRIPFKGLDVATDEKARMLWGRRAGKDEGGRQRKLPGLVQMGMVVGDLVEIEDWNEYGELKQHVKIVAIDGFKTAPASPPVKPNPLGSPPKSFPSGGSASMSKIASISSSTSAALANVTGGTSQPAGFAMAMRSVGEEAAKKAKEAQKAVGKKVVQVAKITPNEKVLVSRVDWSVYMDSLLQARDGTWSVSTNGGGGEGVGGSGARPLSSIVETKVPLQSPTTGRWKNDPMGSIAMGSIDSVFGS